MWASGEPFSILLRVVRVGERRRPELGRDLGLHGRFARDLKTLRQGHRRRICAAVTQLAELTWLTRRTLNL